MLRNKLIAALPFLGAVALVQVILIDVNVSSCTGSTGCAMPWWSAFLPSLIASVVASCVFIPAYTVTTSSEEGSAAWLSVAGLLAGAFCVALGWKLDHPDEGRWVAVMVPLWLVLLFCFLLDFNWPGFSHRFHMFRHQPGSDRADVRLRLYAEVLPKVVLSCVLVFTLLVALRSDGWLDIGFGAVFAPLWIMWAVVVLAMCVGADVATRDFVYEARPRLDASSHTADIAGITALQMFPLVLLLLTQVLVYLKLEHITGGSWSHHLIPLYIFLSLALCMCMGATAEYA